MTFLLPITPAAPTDRVAGSEATATSSTPAGDGFAAFLAPLTTAPASSEVSPAPNEEVGTEPVDVLDTLPTLFAVPDSTIFLLSGDALPSESPDELPSDVTIAQSTQLVPPNENAIETLTVFSADTTTQETTTEQTLSEAFVVETEQETTAVAQIPLPEPLAPNPAASASETTAPLNEVRLPTDLPREGTVEVLPNAVPPDVRAEFSTDSVTELPPETLGETQNVLYSTDTRAAEQLVGPETRPLSVGQTEPAADDSADAETQIIDVSQQGDSEQDTTSDVDDDQFLAALTQVNVAAPIVVRADESLGPVASANTVFNTVEDAAQVEDVTPDVRPLADDLNRGQAGESTQVDAIIGAATAVSQTRDNLAPSIQPPAQPVTAVADSPILNAVTEQNRAARVFNPESSPAADADFIAGQGPAAQLSQSPSADLTNAITPPDTQLPTNGDSIAAVDSAHPQNVPETTATAGPETPEQYADLTSSEPQIEAVRPEVLPGSQEVTVPFQNTGSSSPATTLTSQLLTPVVREAASVYQSNNGSLTVRLDPPELGRVEVHFLQREDGLHIRVEAVEAVTLEMLKSRGGEIERLLRVQDLDIAGVEIDGSGNSQTDGRSDLSTGHQQRDQQTDSSAFGQRHPQGESNDSSNFSGQTRRQDSAPHRIRA